VAKYYFNFFNLYVIINTNTITYIYEVINDFYYEFYNWLFVRLGIHIIIYLYIIYK